MDSIRRYRNGIVRKGFGVCACVCFFFVVFHKIEFISGLVFGAGISMINFYLLSCDMTKLSVLNAQRFRSFMIVRFYLRYGIIALSVYCAGRYGCNMVVFVIGLLLVHMIIMIENVVTVKQAL